MKKSELRKIIKEEISSKNKLIKEMFVGREIFKIAEKIGDKIGFKELFRELDNSDLQIPDSIFEKFTKDIIKLSTFGSENEIIERLEKIAKKRSVVMDNSELKNKIK